MIDSLTYVTSNPGKLRLLRRYLDTPEQHREVD